jgi:hypothetical protein
MPWKRWKNTALLKAVCCLFGEYSGVTRFAKADTILFQILTKIKFNGLKLLKNFYILVEVVLEL